MTPIISLFVSLMLSGTSVQQSAMALNGDQAEDKLAMYYSEGTVYCDSELALYAEKVVNSGDAAPDALASY